jgi:hypothetical protein
VDPPALTGQAVGPGGGFASKKPTAKSDLASRTIDRSNRHNEPCLAARPVGRRSGGRTIGSFGYLFLIAKIANSPLMFGNIGYCFLVAKSANKRRENRQREGWRGVVASLIGAKVLAILARLSCKNNRCRLTHITPPLFFKKTMTILPIALFPSSNQALASPAHWQFSHFSLPSL